MSPTEIAARIEEEFSAHDDWMDKYNYLIDMGKSLEIIDEKYRDKSHLINGCQSRVWLHADYRDGKVHFTADSDAVITKGLVYLLIRVMNDQPPAEIMNLDIGFIDRIGLHEHLSPTRSNGLTSMIKQMKLYATAFSLKESASKND